ncbi:MAG: alpha/beta fold hydrolase [Bradymonadaceae bacterium]
MLQRRRSPRRNEFGQANRAPAGGGLAPRAVPSCQIQSGEKNPRRRCFSAAGCPEDRAAGSLNRRSPVRPDSRLTRDGTTTARTRTRTRPGSTATPFLFKRLQRGWHVSSCTFPRYTLFAPDLPGAGRSQIPDDAGYHPDALAAWIGQFQRTVGIRGCPGVGNSLGGYLAMWLALDDPEATAGVVDVHSPGIPTWRLRALHVLLSAPGGVRLLAWLAGRDPEQWAHRRIHYRDESLKSREETATFAEPLSTSAGARAFAKYMRDGLAPSALSSFVDRLERRRDNGEGFPVPLMLIYADRDPVVPPSIGERLAELIPDAQYETLPRASHFMHVDRPEAFCERILPFLDDVPHG